MNGDFSQGKYVIIQEILSYIKRKCRNAELSRVNKQIC